MKRFSFFGLFLFLMLAGALNAPAVPAYDNGPPSHSDGFELTHWIQADDFPVGVPTRVENIKFWSLEGSGSFQGSFVWQIYSNNANNTPGALLFSGTSIALTRVPTGFDLFNYLEFINTFDIDPVSLPRGRYWIALHNGPLANNSDQGRVFWETSGNNGPTPSASLIAPFVGSWYPHSVPPTPGELAFQIDGIIGPTVTALSFSDLPRISFTTVAGQTYRMEYKDGLTDASWAFVLGGEEIVGTGEGVEASDPDPNARLLGHRFYRARLCPCQIVEGPSVVAFDFAAAPQISFTTVANQLYRVEYKNDISTTSWTPLPGGELVGGTGQAVQISDNDPDVHNLPRRFYRAVLLQ
jgi:hypothetical protein